MVRFVICDIVDGMDGWNLFFFWLWVVSVIMEVHETLRKVTEHSLTLE